LGQFLPNASTTQAPDKSDEAVRSTDVRDVNLAARSHSVSSDRELSGIWRTRSIDALDQEQKHQHRRTFTSITITTSTALIIIAITITITIIINAVVMMR
jgi:hypothetical protein